MRHFHGLLMALSVLRLILPGAEGVRWCSPQDATSERTHQQVVTTELNIRIIGISAHDQRQMSAVQLRAELVASGRLRPTPGLS
jgi:hypothetical protein